VRLEQVDLAAPLSALDELRSFYGRQLGLATRVGSGPSLAVQVGRSRLTFVAHGGRPFHHFAILVPGNRFAVAHAWLGERARLLSHGDGEETRFDFGSWDAEACYVHDPAGNIVELIAHHGLCERPGERAPFTATELLELSEVGLVTDDAHALAEALDAVGLVVWDGVAEAGRLAFVGEQAHTLIIAPRGRGWLPTGRAAEVHPAAVTVRGLPAASATAPGEPYRVATLP
jgi:extradiol dioxygenase family protein